MNYWIFTNDIASQQGEVKNLYGCAAIYSEAAFRFQKLSVAEYTVATRPIPSNTKNRRPQFIEGSEPRKQADALVE